MIINHTMAPDRMSRMRAGAVRPWNSLDAEGAGKVKKARTYDTQEEIDRCIRCPFDRCEGSEVCWYRLGKPGPGHSRPETEGTAPVETVKKPRKPRKNTIDLRDVESRMPAGYDEERLKRAMVHNYLEKDIAAALGLSLYMTKRWIAWRYRE